MNHPKIFTTYLRYLVIFLCIVMIIIIPGPAKAQTEQPVVHAVMFWIDTCSHCNFVREEVLPPLQAKYKDQLKIFQIQIKTAEDLDRLYQIADGLGMAKEDVGVPFIIIGDQVLKGSKQIPTELPGLIERYLAAGGVGYPDIPLLIGVLPTSIPTAVLPDKEICIPSSTPCLTTQVVPVVHLLLFWTPDCHACRQVVDEVIPPLVTQYGQQLDIQYIDVVTGEEVERFYQVAAAFGIPQEDAHLPMIIIGNQALIGAEQIPAELPGLVDTYLAGGGIALPDITRLVETSASVEAVLPERPDGYWLAIGVMVFMIASLLYTMSAMLLDKLPTPPDRWTQIALPFLALIGLGIAIYLSYVETQAVSAMCGPVGDCNAVQASPYTRLFGLLPIGVLGVIGYLMILVAWGYQRLRQGRVADWAALALFCMAMVGVLFSLYLTYLEPFVIKAVCIWCITSAVIMTLLLLITLKPALQAIHCLKEQDHSHTNIEIESPSS